MKLLKYVLTAALLTATATDVQAWEHQRDSLLATITGAEVPTTKVNITRLGAKGNGVKDCKPAFDKAMRMAVKRGGLHIIVPKGIWFVRGPIHLVSNVCIELQEGSLIRFSSEPDDYLPVVETSWEGTWLSNYSPFIYGRGLHNVTIKGKGTIDGNCATTFATWKKLQQPGQQRSRNMNHEATMRANRIFGEGYYLRPHLIQFYECQGVTIEDVFITNSPFWCIHLLKSENIICRGLRYDAKLVNNDGIDPESSRNILIEDILFNNGDDNIAIKSGRDHDGRLEGLPSENIIIRRCHFKGLHAVVIGSEMSGGVRNVFIEDCLTDGYCKRGLYVKTNPDRGGFVKNIYLHNCTFDEVEDLVYVTSMYAGEGLDNHYFAKIDNLQVDGLRCRKVRQAAFVLQGTAARPITNIGIRNVDVEECKTGISYEYTDDVRMRNCFLGGKAGIPTIVSEKDRLFEQ